MTYSKDELIRRLTRAPFSEVAELYSILISKMHRDPSQVMYSTVVDMLKSKGWTSQEFIAYDDMMHTK